MNVLNQMEPGVDNEYYKLKNWVDTFMRIPFGINKSLTITMADGIDKCSDFVVQAKNQLDSCVYGLNDAKMQIMQMIGQWISNPKSLGTAIAIHGPPGTGKTSPSRTVSVRFWVVSSLLLRSADAGTAVSWRDIHTHMRAAPGARSPKSSLRASV